MNDQKYISAFDAISVKYQFRQTNFVAHFLTNQGIRVSLFLDSFSIVCEFFFQTISPHP